VRPGVGAGTAAVTLAVAVGAITCLLADARADEGTGGDVESRAGTIEARTTVDRDTDRRLARWRSAIANDDVATLARLLDDAMVDAAADGQADIEADAAPDPPGEATVGRSSTGSGGSSSLAALVTTRSANGRSALMVACKLGDLGLARELVAAGADPAGTSATGGTPFMFAVLGDRLEVARWLAARGVALDARGSNGWSAVTIAAAKGLDATLAWLIEAGAPADVADLYGFTPLMRAVDNAHEDAARRLLGAGARPDAADESGNTALHHAVAGGRATLVTLLLERGADPGVTNRDGITPAGLAAELASLPSDLRARLSDGVPDEP